MAEIKRFLDLAGLQKYDELIKGVITAGDAAEREYLDNNFKVKDIATSDTVELTNTNGVVTAKVAGNVVVDADYATVKQNANNSAAAWGKFLEGTLSDSTTPSPKLSELATKAELGDLETTLGEDYVKLTEYNQNKQTVTDAIATAKGEAISDAKDYTDGEVTKVNNTITTKVGELTAAIATAKGEAISASNTYTDGKIDEVNNTITTKVGELNQAITDAANAAAKANDDLETELRGVISDGDAATLKSAKDYTDEKDGALRDLISEINTAIAGGVHFRGQVNSVPSTSATIDGVEYNNGDIVFYGDAEYILVKDETTTSWLKLGDTTAEAERLSTLEKAVNETLPAAINKAEEDANTYTDGKIAEVNSSISAINTLIGTKPETATDVFSEIAAAEQRAKTYADTKDGDLKSELIGTSGDATTANTIYGAKNYAQNASDEVYNSILSIEESSITALFS